VAEDDSGNPEYDAFLDPCSTQSQQMVAEDFSDAPATLSQNSQNIWYPTQQLDATQQVIPLRPDECVVSDEQQF
jgi:hypothetical protein